MAKSALALYHGANCQVESLMVTPAKIDPLVIAISSRALFNLEDSHRVFEEKGLDAYQQ